MINMEKFDRFRDKYYYQVRMGGRIIFMPKKDEVTKNRMAEIVKRFGYTGALSDFADVPEQTHREVQIELTGHQKDAIRELSQIEADPLVRRARTRTIENGVLYGKKVETISDKEDILTQNTIIFPSKKIDYILERAEEFPKLLVFANYTAQIYEIQKVLVENGYNAVTLTGQTKDRTTVIQKAEESEACIVIAQSSISSGYELPSFPCVIYASKSWRFVDFEQSLGRVLRINKLKKNLYIHLITSNNGPDSDCHKAIMSGQDFQEKLTLNI